MPGANLGLSLVPLDSDPPTFAILGRFPKGFVRVSPGGYLAAEEFVVLDGYLEIEGARYRSGALVHIPARFLRTEMRAPHGCTVLAWFGGDAEFRTPDYLTPPATSAVSSVDLKVAPTGVVMETEEARWTLIEDGTWPNGAEGFDIDAIGWARTEEDWIGRRPTRMIFRQSRSHR